MAAHRRTETGRGGGESRLNDPPLHRPDAAGRHCVAAEPTTEGGSVLHVKRADTGDDLLGGWFAVPRTEPEMRRFLAPGTAAG